MAKLTLTHGDISLQIEQVSTDPDDWKTIEMENYKPDRDQHILDKFIEDHPDIALPKGDDDSKVSLIYALCSRSSALAEWLQNANASYALEATLPRYIEGIVSPKVFTEAEKALTKISNLQKARSVAESAANAKYKTDMAIAKKTFDDNSAKLKTNNVIKILNVKSTDLPITLQLAIENFVPASDANSPDKKTYAREVLLNYRLALFKFISENPSADIDLVISSMRLK